MCVRFYQVWFGASDEKLDQSDPNYEAEVDTEIIGGALMAYTIITPLVSQHTGGFFSPKEGKIIILFFLPLCRSSWLTPSREPTESTAPPSTSSSASPAPSRSSHWEVRFEFKLI